MIFLGKYCKKENGKAGKKIKRKKLSLRKTLSPLQDRNLHHRAVLLAHCKPLTVTGHFSRLPRSSVSELFICSGHSWLELTLELADSRVMRKAILPSYPGSGLK